MVRGEGGGSGGAVAVQVGAEIAAAAIQAGIWEALQNLARGKASKADVDALSLWFKGSVEKAWKPEDDLDREFQLHLAYVFWQIVQWLRYEGLSANAVEGIGRLLRRLFLVYLAYKEKKKRFTRIEWLGQLLGILSDLKGLTGG